MSGERPRPSAPGHRSRLLARLACLASTSGSIRRVATDIGQGSAAGRPVHEDLASIGCHGLPPSRLMRKSFVIPYGSRNLRTSSRSTGSGRAFGTSSASSWNPVLRSTSTTCCLLRCMATTLPHVTSSTGELHPAGNAWTSIGARRPRRAVTSASGSWPSWSLDANRGVLVRVPAVDREAPVATTGRPKPASAVPTQPQGEYAEGTSVMLPTNGLKPVHEPAGMDTGAAVVRTDSSRPQMVDLPIQTTDFVGREHETDEVLRLLTQGRVCTLAGPGGCGKTRLARVSMACDVSDPKVRPGRRDSGGAPRRCGSTSRRVIRAVRGHPRGGTACRLPPRSV